MMGCYHKIVIQCNTINLPPLVTYNIIDTEQHDSERTTTTWSELCRRTIENDYLHSSTYLLALLKNIHSRSYTTQQSSQQQRQQQQQQQQHQQLAYRLRYDLGMGTIIKPTWSDSFKSPTSLSRAGVREVHNMNKDKEEAYYYYIDVNVYLQSANNNGLKFEPYESIHSSLSKGGGGGREGTTTTATTTTTKTTFVNLHISPVRYEEDSDDDDEDNVHRRRRRPFPITKEMTRILICKEHDYFPYIIDSYYFIDDKNVDGSLDNESHNDAVVHFLRNARCIMNSLQDSKEEEEEEDEAYNKDSGSTMIEFDDNFIESTNKVTGEEPAHDSAINFGQVDNNDTHENIEEGCNDGDSSSYEDEDTSSSEENDASREKNQQHLHDNDTSKNCKAGNLGESLNNNKQLLASEPTSPSKNALKRMRRTNNDAALHKTDEEVMHRVNDSVSGGGESGEEERGGGFIKAKAGTPSSSTFTLDTPFSVGVSAGHKRQRQPQGEKSPIDDCKSTTAVNNDNDVSVKKNGGDNPPSLHDSLAKVTTSAAAGKESSIKKYLKMKQAGLRLTEASIVTIDARGAASDCEDAIVAQLAGMTSQRKCANSNMPTTEEGGGTTQIITVGTSKQRISTKKRQEDQEEGKKTDAAHSRAGSITSFNSSESIIPTTEIPAKAAIGFPPGWTTRLIPRIVNNKKRGNTRYYSPKLEYSFLTKGKANEFMKLLEEIGDEKEAMILFTKKGKGKGKKTAVDISVSVSSMPLVDELSLVGNNNSAKAIVATSKIPKRTNTSTKAVQELASLKVVESLTADAEQSQSKKRKTNPKTGKNTKEKNTKKITT